MQVADCDIIMPVSTKTTKKCPTGKCPPSKKPIAEKNVKPKRKVLSKKKPSKKTYDYGKTLLYDYCIRFPHVCMSCDALIVLMS